MAMTEIKLFGESGEELQEGTPIQLEVNKRTTLIANLIRKMLRIKQLNGVVLINLYLRWKMGLLLSVELVLLLLLHNQKMEKFLPHVKSLVLLR